MKIISILWAGLFLSFGWTAGSETKADCNIENYSIKEGVHECDLNRADLRGADLIAAYLGGSNLRGADLREADLTKAKWAGAKVTPEQAEFLRSKGHSGFVVVE